MAKKNVIGVDLGGTKIALGRVDEEGRVLEFLRYDTDTRGGSRAVMEQIVTGVGKLDPGSAYCLDGIGIGVAGQIDPETGAVRFGPNLDWHDVPLRAVIERACGAEVVVTNDVRAALYGEWLFGAGRGARDLLCIFVGTGIGGGIVSGGQVIDGCSNTAGEIGHITVDLDGPPCHCGNRGCMEALAGGWAIAQRVREMIRADPGSGKTIVEMSGGSIEEVTARTLAQAFHGGDALARKVLYGAADALSAGISGLVNVLNPCRIILGGGIIEGIPELVSRIDEGIRKRALQAATERLAVCPSQLGNNAGIIGAAALAMRIFRQD